ncbi:MAG: DUF429 domain-containing protein [Proteobacteria bacterium]|nr:DUF429 domain-containing protein [Pseudomonadota bacterium]
MGAGVTVAKVRRGAEAEADEPTLLGCDFSSRPRREKTIVIALGRRSGAAVVLLKLEHLTSLDAFGAWLHRPGPWVGAFDFPFGLPRELVAWLGWPTEWGACIEQYALLTREQIRERFVAFCAARPAGKKFAHRRTDGPAGSSPSMKWVNPPVALMLHAGVPRLRDAGVHLPGLQDGNPARVALEGYPGLLAREILGRRSYKSDSAARQTADRLLARRTLIDALESGRTRLGLRLELDAAQRNALIEDARGDRLDAVLCLLQAGWAQLRHAQGAPLYGLPLDVDPLEGWIVTA